ncbi:SH3 domain-containing protein [Streptomyces sp. BA2]|uniref:SH3 domain-containing protein n=1 Tax=Streptomyces sp. BA2 TaxID=436595 RepID=UPI0013282A5B|nr:SH3 domain-containing protein [Streptomyces sp. BA2]MWA08205.1 SH3 domain-containing protein [Streptomyces sp. BA2]
MKKSKFASALAVGAMVVTGVLAGASSASAVGSSACTENTPNTKVAVTETVHFRTGPGKSYTSKGLVGKAENKFYQYCERGDWAYGKVLKGAHKGKMGWINEYYIGWPMNPPGS